MDDISIEEAIAISEAVQKHKADAWDEGMKFGMNELALRGCIRTEWLNTALEEGLKNNPFRK